MKKTRREKAPTPKPLVGFRPDPEVYAAILRLQARDGIPISEQLRRAMRPYLQKEGVLTLKKEKTR